MVHAPPHLNAESFPLVVITMSAPPPPPFLHPNTHLLGSRRCRYLTWAGLAYSGKALGW